MGWERKRGKLLDLNKFLRGEYDSFPDQGRRPFDSAAKFASSSRSIPTPNCRADRRTAWSARWRIL